MSDSFNMKEHRYHLWGGIINWVVADTAAPYHLNYGNLEEKAPLDKQTIVGDGNIQAGGDIFQGLPTEVRDRIKKVMKEVGIHLSDEDIDMAINEAQLKKGEDE